MKIKQNNDHLYFRGFKLYHTDCDVGYKKRWRFINKTPPLG